MLFSPSCFQLSPVLAAGWPPLQFLGFDDGGTGTICPEANNSSSPSIAGNILL